MGPDGTSDPALLAWAAKERHILITHERQTTPKQAYDRIRARLKMPGVILVSHTAPVGEAIELVTLYLKCGSAAEFDNHIVCLL